MTRRRAPWVMLGRCALLSRDLPEARAALALAADQIACLPDGSEADARYRAAQARLIGMDQPPDVVRGHLQQHLAWAAGRLALRLEDWPGAQGSLEAAVEAARHAEDCGDLLALALADLAVVSEAAGDVVDARCGLIEALRLAREHDLATLWPGRWAALLQDAERLEAT